jgi:hypothetical protein
MANTGYTLSSSFLTAVIGKKKKKKATCGFEMGIGSEALIIGWY